MTLTMVRQSIRLKARDILVAAMSDGEWDTLVELRTLIGAELDRFLVKTHPNYVLDFVDVRRVKVKGTIDLLEVDLDIIRTDQPSSWSAALFFKENPVSPQQP